MIIAAVTITHTLYLARDHSLMSAPKKTKQKLKFSTYCSKSVKQRLNCFVRIQNNRKYTFLYLYVKKNCLYYIWMKYELKFKSCKYSNWIFLYINFDFLIAEIYNFQSFLPFHPQQSLYSSTPIWAHATPTLESRAFTLVGFFAHLVCSTYICITLINTKSHYKTL